MTHNKSSGTDTDTYTDIYRFYPLFIIFGRNLM